MDKSEKSDSVNLSDGLIDTGEFWLYQYAPSHSFAGRAIGVVFGLLPAITESTVFELLTASQMQQADALSIAASTDSFLLMQNASAAVANAVLHRLPEQGSVVVVSGSGNNGGDGAVAAALLHAKGIAVQLLRFGLNSPNQQDARRAFDQWPGDVLVIDEKQSLTPAVIQAINGADVIVDALFGAGLSRDIDGTARLLVESINSSKAQVVSVDLPSGVNGNQHSLCTATIVADHTVTFFRFKPAHFLYPTRAHCGQLELAQIGINDSVLSQLNVQTELNDPGLWKSAIPAPAVHGHKYHRGHVLVRSGDPSSTGAARLSAQTALQCGAGLVTVASPSDALAINASHLTAVMLRSCDSPSGWVELLSDSRFNTAILGPGNGVDEATRQCVNTTLERGVNTVLDADALSSFAECPKQLISALAASESQSVLTPHAGEFNRVFGKIAECNTQSSRLYQACSAAALTQSVVVLKGPDTIIAAPDGRSRINAHAPPWLATAGSGDVLAGIIGALLSQGMQDFDAACAAVWIHGDAAIAHGYPVTSEQLIEAAAQSLGKLLNLSMPGSAIFS